MGCLQQYIKSVLKHFLVRDSLLLRFSRSVSFLTDKNFQSIVVFYIATTVLILPVTALSATSVC